MKKDLVRKKKEAEVFVAEKRGVFFEVSELYHKHIDLYNTVTDIIACGHPKHYVVEVAEDGKEAVVHHMPSSETTKVRRVSYGWKPARKVARNHSYGDRVKEERRQKRLKKKRREYSKYYGTWE